VNSPADRGQPMPHGGVNQIPPTRQAVIASWPIEQPGGALPSYAPGQPLERTLGTVPSRDPRTDDTSFAGVTTSGSTAPAW
jgi:hypothetical protein